MNQCVSRPEVNNMSSWITLYVIFETGPLSPNVELTDSARLTDQQALGISYLCLLSPGITDKYLVLLFTCVLEVRVKFSFSHLYIEHLTN